MSSTTTYPAGSNDALVTQLTKNFLLQVHDQCSSETAAILVCDMQNVLLNKCRASLSCTNTGDLKSYVCAAGQAADALVKSFGSLTTPPTPAQIESMRTLTSSLQTTPGYDPNDPGSMAAVYMTQRCNSRLFSQQSTTLPIVQLTDCSGDIITALNSLDATTKCAMGSLSELVPPDPEPVVSDRPVPLWDNPLIMTLLACGAAIILCAAALAAVGIARS